MVGLVEARRGKVRQGEARPGLAVMVCHGLTRHGRVGIGWASYGGYGEAGPVTVW